LNKLRWRKGIVAETGYPESRIDQGKRFSVCCEKKQRMQYTVIVHNAEEGGYWVEVPSLPGCFSQGETIDEAMNNAREAIELHIQGLRDEGQEVPTEKDLVIGRVDIQAA
jgi:predicted RNase H-like HicB family nuclease